MVGRPQNYTVQTYGGQSWRASSRLQSLSFRLADLTCSRSNLPIMAERFTCGRLYVQTPHLNKQTRRRCLRGPRYIYSLQTESRHRCTARAPCCFSNLHSCISINHISKKWKTGHFRVLRISSREGANVLYHSLGAPLKINIFEIWRKTAGQYFSASAQSLDYCLWWFSPSSSHFHTWRFINLFKASNE